MNSGVKKERTMARGEFSLMVFFVLLVMSGLLIAASIMQHSTKGAASRVSIAWGSWQRLRPGEVLGESVPDGHLRQTYVLYSVSKPLVKCVAYSERASTEMPWRNEFRTDFEPDWTQADRDAVLASCMAHDR